MTFNLFIKYGIGGFNILNLPEEKLPIILSAYKKGDYKFTISGAEYNWGELKELKIFRNESSFTNEKIEEYCQKNAGWIRVFGAGHLISPNLLGKLGPDVTGELLEDIPFGSSLGSEENYDEFIDQARIQSLDNLENQKFDLKKLITICNELNSNWAVENYYTVGLLLRTIINHVPPIFDPTYTTFGHVIANYGSQSFKKSMEHLNISLRSIADSYTHDLIRKKEILPSKQQVDFRANIDVLLVEILRKLN